MNEKLNLIIGSGFLGIMGYFAFKGSSGGFSLIAQNPIDISDDDDDIITTLLEKVKPYDTSSEIFKAGKEANKILNVLLKKHKRYKTVSKVIKKYLNTHKSLSRCQKHVLETASYFAMRDIGFEDEHLKDYKTSIKLKIKALEKKIEKNKDLAAERFTKTGDFDDRLRNKYLEKVDKINESLIALKKKLKK